MKKMNKKNYLMLKTLIIYRLSNKNHLIQAIFYVLEVGNPVGVQVLVLKIILLYLKFVKLTLTINCYFSL